VYALTPDADELFPDNFAALAGSLVRQLKQVLPPEQVESAFRAVAHELAQDMKLRPLDEQSTEARLEEVTRFLNERGYLARWEPDENEPGTYLLHKCNCPYSGVSSEHGELCQMDQALVDELMGKVCPRTDSMTVDGRCCTYRVSAPHATEIMLLA
jgi:predicted ArsR family transcriptional regulator